MALEAHPIPAWIVVGAGTGGTSATIGRYVRYRALDTRVCVVDPEGSAFLPAWRGEFAESECTPSRIEGIGRARPEPSFLPPVVDRRLGIPDAASVAAVHFLRERTGIDAGPSTGTNLYGMLLLAAQMRAAGERGSLVSLVCDRGERYAATYGDPDWLATQGIDVRPYTDVLTTACDRGEWVG